MALPAVELRTRTSEDHCAHKSTGPREHHERRATEAAHQ